MPQIIFPILDKQVTKTTLLDKSKLFNNTLIFHKVCKRYQNINELCITCINVKAESKIMGKFPFHKFYKIMCNVLNGITIQGTKDSQSEKSDLNKIDNKKNRRIFCICHYQY